MRHILPHRDRKSEKTAGRSGQFWMASSNEQAGVYLRWSPYASLTPPLRLPYASLTPFFLGRFETSGKKVKV